ncbi:unnamed protein product [Camellia sinensis]
MFASRSGLTAADIRNWMGDFRQIRNVAKYAARLGQSFGSSTETLSVSRHEMEIIPDVEVVTRGIKYVFSDGIGKISADFGRRVAKKCGLKSSTTSAFQIRYGGYKGVVAVDPNSSMKLSLRMRMSKYESHNTKLDVLAWSKYQPCFLNRQLITLLSTLGVRDHIFEKKQREAIEELNTILTEPLMAQEALELMSPGENTNILKEMLLCVAGIRTKTRIFVPRGRSMMGCLDETRTLEYGQVFVQISGVGHRPFYDNSLLMLGGCGSDQHNHIVEGKVVVAKNHCLHPGDVRVLSAVNVPALHHMVDCVVFPQQGMSADSNGRPHPNECSGSDLDGNIYFVCWDPDLIPPRQIQPMDYTPAPSMLSDHDVTIEEVEEYFTNYIVNDSLGIIANAHTVFADREPLKAMSDPCIKLAQLFSIAVDFPKTGVPAEIPTELRVKIYPDFMEKPDKTTYELESVIGKLFLAVKDISPQSSSFKSFTRDVARNSYDPDMEVDGFEDYVDDAFDYKSEYDYKLGNQMDYFGIKTEAEILSGSIMKMLKSFDWRRDAEDVGLAVRSLRKEARTWFNMSRTTSDAESDDVYAKASACTVISALQSVLQEDFKATEIEDAPIISRNSHLSKQLVCFDACKKLHQMGALNDHLLPFNEEPSINDSTLKSKGSTSSAGKLSIDDLALTMLGFMNNRAAAPAAKNTAPITEEIIRLNGIYKRLLSNAGVKLYEGEGKIVGPNEVEVTQLDGTKICYSAKHILIATGSRAYRPAIPGQELAITSDEALSLEELPKRAVILGGRALVRVSFNSNLQKSDYNMNAVGSHLYPQNPVLRLGSQLNFSVEVKITNYMKKLEKVSAPLFTGLSAFLCVDWDLGMYPAQNCLC